VAAVLAERGLAAAEDADADGLSNRYEVSLGLNPLTADSDSDAISDSTEVALGTDALAMDSDADGLTDRIELDFGSDPLTTGNPKDGWGAGLGAEGPVDPAGGGTLESIDVDVDLS